MLRMKNPNDRERLMAAAGGGGAAAVIGRGRPLPLASQIGYGYQSRTTRKHAPRTNHHHQQQHSANGGGGVPTLLLAHPNKSVITKQSYLVFDGAESSNNYASTAILCISNPSDRFDVFYKLCPDNNRAGFKVRSWKGHVYRSSCVEMPVSTNIVAGSDDDYVSNVNNNNNNNNNNSKGVTLAQLLQTTFTLDVSEYINNYRTNYQSYSFNSYGSHSQQQQQGDKFGSHPTKIRIELQCVTRNVLLKMQSDCKVNLSQIVWQSTSTTTPTTATTVPSIITDEDEKPKEDNDDSKHNEHANSINQNEPDTLALECAEVVAIEDKEKDEEQTQGDTQGNLETQTQIEKFKGNIQNEEKFNKLEPSSGVHHHHHHPRGTTTGPRVSSTGSCVLFLALAVLTIGLVLASWLKP